MIAAQASPAADADGRVGLWLGRRGVRVIWLLALPPVALEIYHGNIHLWIAAAIALGFRYPWTWGFVLLTKVTPGIGLLWFAVRREWQALGVALGAVAEIKEPPAGASPLARASALTMSAPIDVDAGELQVEAQVEVTFLLEGS